jgi:ribosomal protein S18 acetylase RimI-like enzyme
VDIEFRPARHANLEDIKAILLEEPAPDLRAIARDLATVRRIGSMLAPAGMLVHIDHTVLAFCDSRCVGLMETLRSKSNQSLGIGASLMIVARATWHAGPSVVRRYLRLTKARERMAIRIPEGEFDLNELDVHPAFRNRGIGGQMLTQAERAARADGFPRIWLTTEINNAARRLYERHGFRVEREARDAGYEAMTGAPGRVLMVKEW